MRRGYTLIELLVVIAIIAIIVIARYFVAGSQANLDDLKDTAKQMEALLRQAQSNSMAQSQEVSWGVHFANATNTTPFYSLFESSYATGTVMGTYTLPSTVSYTTSTLGVGSSTDITFSQISGIASASKTIGLYLTRQPSQSSTISVASSGEVSY
jgi:prepilin-type N-terminal cleavage/methylation domain-containing protein